MTGKKKGPVNPRPKANTYADIKKRHKEQKELKELKKAQSDLRKENKALWKAQAGIPSQAAQDEEDQKQLQPVSEHDQKHQQRVLDVFRRAFDDALSSGRLIPTLQSVKQALYDRDFAKAFGDPEHLEVYAARWSPTRALCYASVLARIQDHIDDLSPPTQPITTTPSDGKGDSKEGDETETTPADDVSSKPPQDLKIISIGGGAAEVAAVGAYLNQRQSPPSTQITLIDSGPWESVVTKLTTALTTPPPISKYASEAAKLANTCLVPASHLHPTFLQKDVLALDRPQLTSLFGADPVLVTILFTLNELFTAAGIGKTTTFLMDLTSAVPIGSLLLVVDSPGSYSETTIGKEAKRYPMQWLMDKILLDTARSLPATNGRRWTKIEAHDSLWFRLASEGRLEYPIQLENMRYQMHLYRAEDASSEGRDD